MTEQFLETARAPASWSASAESHLSQHSDRDSLEVHLCEQGWRELASNSFVQALGADVITADQVRVVRV